MPDADLTSDILEIEPVYKLAIVAAAFSQRLQYVMNEACHFLRVMNTRAVIVNVGDDTPENRSKLTEAVRNSYFKDYPCRMEIRSGQPAEVLLAAAEEMKADLIVAGALSKEHLVKYVMGSTARRIARQAPCSVLLFTDPQMEPKPIENIHCAVEYDRKAQSAVKITAYLAAVLKVQNLYFTHTFQIPNLLENKKEGVDSKKIIRAYQREDQRLKKHLAKYDFYGQTYHTQCLYERNKSVTLAFNQEIATDLFVLPGYRNSSSLWDRLFRPDNELSLQHLPCATLLTR